MQSAAASLFRGTSRYASRAHFSTSPLVELDLSGLYGKLTGWRRKRPANAVLDPTTGSDTEKSDDSMPVASRPRKLTILGKPKSLEEDWPAVRAFAEFKPWPTNHYRKDLTPAQIDSVLSALQKTDFNDIQARFDAVKQAATELKIGIPDPVLTTLGSWEDLRAHLLQSARPFDERQPDAIYLDQQDYIGTNVIISDPVAERKAQKQKLHEVVKQARDAQKHAADEIMRAA